MFSAYLSIAAVLILILGLFASHEARQFYVDQKAVELETGARACRARIGADSNWSEPKTIDALCDELGNSLGMRVTVMLSSGEVVGDSSAVPEAMENHRDRPEIEAALHGGVGRSTRFSGTVRQEMMYVAVPLVRAGDVTAVVRTSFPIQSLGETLAVVYRRIAVVGLLAAIAIATASLVVAQRIARPLESIRLGAERYARGELKHRLPLVGAQELQELAQAMNQMANDLEQRIQEIVSRGNEHQAVLSSMEDGVLAVDQQAMILNINDACARLLNIDTEKARGRFVHEVIRKPSLLDFVERTLSTPDRIEEDLESVGPQNRSLHAHGTMLCDGENRRIGALIVVRDITRLKHLETVRREFVANVSHELRTPITSIKGFVETILHEELADREQSLRFLGIVLKQTNRLDAIIHDLLMLSRVERGNEEQTIELHPEPLSDVLRSAAEMCEQEAKEKQIGIEIQCGDEVRARMNAPLLEQAVVNLIDNAIKYSETGSTVRVVACEQAGEVVVRVEDRGCGIAAKHLPRLFERFYRVDRSRSRELGGTGLGLAIVKHIVAAHNGFVRVESSVGAGSTFCIHLPGVDSANDAAPSNTGVQLTP